MEKDRHIEVFMDGKSYIVHFSIAGEPVSVRAGVVPEGPQHHYWRRIWSVGQCRDMTPTAARVVIAAKAATN